MSGPWEDFQSKESGPWDDFKENVPRGTPEPGWKDYTSTIARPLLEAGGAVGGGLIGSGMGPVGTAAGGALGYGAGKAGADLLDRSLGVKPLLSSPQAALRETGQDIKQGGMNEAIGMGIGATAKPILSKVGKVASQLGEWATAIPERDFRTVAKNPTSILPGQLEKAGTQFGEAMDNAGISDKLTPEMTDILKNPSTYAFDTFKKLQESGTLTPQEALYGKRAVDAIYPVPNPKNGSYIRMLDEMKSQFDNIITSQTPELKEASKDYAVAKAGSKFQSLFPRTKAGKPAYFRSGAILGGLATGHPQAALGIPAVAGGITATAGPTGIAASELASNPITAPALAQPATSFLKNKMLDDKTALEYLDKAGGDKEKALQMLQADGY